MEVSVDTEEVLGPRLAELRNTLRKKPGIDMNEKALLRELELLTRAALIVTPAQASGPLESDGNHRLEVRVGSGQGGPVRVICSNKDCPHAGP